MAFGHERLEVYRVALDYVGWVHQLCQRLKGAHGNAKDQILRAAQSIPLNIAEGNGKATAGDRRRYFEIARGSVLECAAAQEVLEICGALAPGENATAKIILDRLAAMLTRLGQRGYTVREAEAEYSANRIGGEVDSDADGDSGTQGVDGNDPDGDSDGDSGT